MSYRRIGILFGAALVLAWRVTAFLFPHTADTDPLAIRHAHALMGLWFLACGLFVGMRLTGPLSVLFAAYCLASGVHWGGPIGMGSASAQNLWLAAYIVVSTSLAQGLFLDLALRYPPPAEIATKLGWRLVVYLPVLAGLVLLLLLAIDPSHSVTLQAIGLLFPIGVLVSLFGGIVWIRRWFVAAKSEREQHCLSLVVVVMVAAWLPHALATTFGPLMPPYDGLFDLSLSAIPTVLAIALARRQSPGDAVLSRSD